MTLMGVEEEYVVVDPITREATPAAGRVVERASAELGERVCTEITRFQVEAKTPPCQSVDDLYASLRRMRAVVAAAAAEEGLRVIASGTPVMGQVVPPPITEHPRYEIGVRTYRALHDELSICACHVHVDLPDRDRALLVSNHLRPWLPVLIAIAANSPYWAGRDTGYASWRTVTWGRWPAAGPPPYFNSLAHCEELVSVLRDGGVLVDSGTLFWDIRPSNHLPTLEVRVTDVPMTAEESAVLAALVRALVTVFLADVERGDSGPMVSAELLRAAYWRAARDGLEGHGIDVRTGCLVSARDLVSALVDRAHPALEHYGDLHIVREGLRRLRSAGCGAVRQRVVYGYRGELSDVVDHLIEQTAGT